MQLGENKGQSELAKSRRPKTANSDAPWGNIEWAVETLKDLERVKPNNPSVEADRAEAEVLLARTRAHGVETLEGLDRKDLLGSPHAYLALARARRESGDRDGMLAAARRCAAMSTDRRQCRIAKFDI